MMSGRKQPIFARQQWGTSSAAAAATTPKSYGYKIDRTWMIPFEHHATNNSRLIFKAGNKDYTLDGSIIDAGGRKSVSEIALKKRYS